MRDVMPNGVTEEATEYNALTVLRIILFVVVVGEERKKPLSVGGLCRLYITLLAPSSSLTPPSVPTEMLIIAHTRTVV